MTAIWSSDESGWTLLSPTGFEDEATLHRLIEESPELLPLSGKPQLAVLGSEVQLGTGYADIVAVEPTGRLTIIEVKLAKNAEARRAIVSQILAYAAFLHRTDPSVLEETILAAHLNARGHTSVGSAMMAGYQEATLDVAEFNGGLASALETGKFRLVLVLDEAPPELVRLVGYLEAITDGLVIDLVTISAYEVEGTKVIVPQRVDPERQPVEEKTAGAAPGRNRAYSVPGAEDWLEAAEGSPDPALKTEMERYAAWVGAMEDEGLVKPVTTHGLTSMTLVPRFKDSSVGLVTVYRDASGSYVSLFRSVFEKRAPHAMGSVEAQMQALGVPLGQGTAVRNPSQSFLDSITDAYREAMSPSDVVIVAARSAYPEYRDLSAYICQVGRGFRDGLTRMGFYTGKEIKPEFPRITHRRAKISISGEAAQELRDTGVAIDARIADIIERLVASGNERVGGENQIFLLTPPDSDDTTILDRPIRHESPGAWVQQQRYTRSEYLEGDPATTAELEGGLARP